MLLQGRQRQQSVVAELLRLFSMGMNCIVQSRFCWPACLAVFKVIQEVATCLHRSVIANFHVAHSRQFSITFQRMMEGAELLPVLERKVHDVHLKIARRSLLSELRKRKNYSAPKPKLRFDFKKETQKRANPNQAGKQTIKSKSFTSQLSTKVMAIDQVLKIARCGAPQSGFATLFAQ